ncbi:MAG: cation:proton antiporter [ANME-2 cluster archaeon]|nr:cation:proton antiporter [ANME-2 cluster archaeon]MDF1558046.1 cation:proton antiporter [ANME-2 cluster archaeon]
MIDISHNIELQISLLLFVSLVGHLVAQRIGQSIVVGEILVGILVGPSLLGLITYTDFIASTATMGAIFLLFAVGLQTKIKDISNVTSLLVALVGVIIPWIGGYLLAVLFGYNTISAIYVGTALTATSVAITAHVLKEMGKLDAPASKIIIGAAVVDDVLGLLALSITTEFAIHEITALSIIKIAVIALVFLFFGVYLGMNFFARKLENLYEWSLKHNMPMMTFIGAVTVAFLYSVIAELAGLSGIVGAFIAGISLENTNIKCYRVGASYLEAIFASIFFVSLGILVDLHAASGAVVFVLALTIVAIFTKLIGGYLPSRVMGVNHIDSVIVGLGIVPRGEIAMIAALIGLNAGVIGQEIYSSILIMSLLTTIFAPILITRIYKKRAHSSY